MAVDGSHGSVVAFKPATRASCCVVMVERSGSTRVMLDEGSCAREASCCHGLVDASPETPVKRRKRGVSEPPPASTRGARSRSAHCPLAQLFKDKLGPGRTASSWQLLRGITERRPCLADPIHVELNRVAEQRLLERSEVVLLCPGLHVEGSARHAAR